MFWKENEQLTLSPACRPNASRYSASSFQLVEKVPSAGGMSFMALRISRRIQENDVSGVEGNAGSGIDERIQ